MSALRKLEPVKDTVLYRGFIKNSGIYTKTIDYTKLKKDDVVIWDNFTSTSTKERTAESFIQKDKGGYILEIHGNYCGYNIKDFSMFIEEGIYSYT